MCASTTRLLLPLYIYRMVIYNSYLSHGYLQYLLVLKVILFCFFTKCLYQPFSLQQYLI